MNLQIYLIKEKFPKSKHQNSKNAEKKKQITSSKTNKNRKNFVIKNTRQRSKLSMILQVAKLQMI